MAELEFKPRWAPDLAFLAATLYCVWIGDFLGKLHAMGLFTYFKAVAASDFLEWREWKG